MNHYLRGTAVGALLCATLSGASAEELRFDQLYVIGDSLSDGGAYSQAVQAGGGGLLPQINYRFLTNAPDGSSTTYAENLGTALGIDVLPNVFSAVPAAGLGQVTLGGTNYAQGGARVSNPQGIGFSPSTGITTLPMTTQVDRLLAEHPTLGANDLILLWGGANDVFVQAGAVGAAAATPAQAGAALAQAATELVAQVDRLRAAGAENIVVVTVPDIGTTPFGLSLGAQGAALQTGLVNAFNSQLVASIDGKAVIVDAEQLLSAIRSDPLKYGFTAPNAATVPACPDTALTCLQGINASADSEERLFADGVHPTTASHALLGEAAFAGLQAATQRGAIGVASLNALRQGSLSLENRLNPTVLRYTDANGVQQRRDVGDIDYFASFEVGTYSSDAQQVTPGASGNSQVAKFGFDIAVAPNATLGAGLSIDRGEVDFDGGRGGFDQRLIVGALFGQVALSRSFYMNAAFGGGGIDVTDVTRSFTLGPARETYTAETEGRYRFARIGAGGFVPLSDEVLLNPFAHYTREKVSIDGFTESTGAASLSYGDTDYTADRVTLGLSAIFQPKTMPDWTFNVRGSIEHDLNDDPLYVSLGPDASTLGTVSAPRPDRTWGYLSGSVVRDVGPGAFVSFTASAALSQSGSSGYTASIAYKKSF